MMARQNHSMVGRGHSGSPGPTPCSGRFIPEPMAQDYVQTVLEYLQLGDSAASLGNLFQLPTRKGKEMWVTAQRNEDLITKDVEKAMSGSFFHLVEPDQASSHLIAELGQVKHQFHSDEAAVKVQPLWVRVPIKWILMLLQCSSAQDHGVFKAAPEAMQGQTPAGAPQQSCL